MLGFSDALLELLRRWTAQEEYSHGFLIPVIAAWLLWTRREAIVASIGTPSWTGPLLIVLAAALHVVGKLSSLFLLPQLAFIVALIGIVLAFGGFALLKVTWLPIVFLLFAIPLPYVVDAGLSFQLQLLSSQLGVAFIRLFQIPVYLEGNVIDLGVYKLQVVEACSGLRYLYPLMSLGFLAAYLFQAPLWQRALVFLSTIPITIAMNSLRIGLVGVLVDHFGPQDADGFLHMFEGWIIFIACAGLLAAEMWLLARFVSRQKVLRRVLSAELGELVRKAERRSDSQHVRRGRQRARADDRLPGADLRDRGIGAFRRRRGRKSFPQRKLFARFPTSSASGAAAPPRSIRRPSTGLGLTDYILSDYAKRDGRSVNFYVAYYANQRTGSSPHSPASASPAMAGSSPISSARTIPSSDGRVSLPFNRVVIGKGQQKQLVYYWFEAARHEDRQRILVEALSAARRIAQKSHRRRAGAADHADLSGRA